MNRMTGIEKKQRCPWRKVHLVGEISRCGIYICPLKVIVVPGGEQSVRRIPRVSWMPARRIGVVVAEEKLFEPDPPMPATEASGARR